MIDGTKPAFPASVSIALFGQTVSSFDVQDGEGISVRSYIATEAMRGILASSVGVTNDAKLIGSLSPKAVAKRSIEYADALIASL